MTLRIAFESTVELTIFSLPPSDSTPHWPSECPDRIKAYTRLQGYSMRDRALASIRKGYVPRYLLNEDMQESLRQMQKVYVNTRKALDEQLIRGRPRTKSDRGIQHWHPDTYNRNVEQRCAFCDDRLHTNVFGGFYNTEYKGLSHYVHSSSVPRWEQEMANPLGKFTMVLDGFLTGVAGLIPGRVAIIVGESEVPATASEHVINWEEAVALSYALVRTEQQNVGSNSMA